MSDDDGQLKPTGAELARRVHDTVVAFGEKTANLGSIVCAEVPGVGTVLAAIGAGEMHDLKQRVAMLEAALEETPAVEVFRVLTAMSTPHGRQHVRSILEQARRTDDAEHMQAIANAFVSGFGLHTFAPSRVRMLDDALREMTAGHVALMRHGADLQRGMTLEERFQKGVRGRDVAAVLRIEGGIAQKLATDLLHLGVFLDPSHNFLSSHYGLQTIALSSFGLDLVRYVEEPAAYQGTQPPPMEGIDPPAVSIPAVPPAIPGKREG